MKGSLVIFFLMVLVALGLFRLGIWLLERKLAFERERKEKEEKMRRAKKYRRAKRQWM